MKKDHNKKKEKEGLRLWMVRSGGSQLTWLPCQMLSGWSSGPCSEHVIVCRFLAVFVAFYSRLWRVWFRNDPSPQSGEESRIDLAHRLEAQTSLFRLPVEGGLWDHVGSSCYRNCPPKGISGIYDGDHHIMSRGLGSSASNMLLLKLQQELDWAMLLALPMIIYSLSVSYTHLTLPTKRIV